MNIINNCFHLLFPFSAYETSKMFTTASDSLASLDQKIFGHWRAYFNLKSKFYMSHVCSILCILQLIMYLFIYLLKRFFPYIGAISDQSRTRCYFFLQKYKRLRKSNKFVVSIKKIKRLRQKMITIAIFNL